MLRLWRWYDLQRSGGERVYTFWKDREVICWADSQSSMWLILNEIMDWDEFHFMARYLKPGDIIDPDFRDIVFAMRVGDLSRAVPTESGYCIIQVTDAHESGSVRELEEVRGEIVNRVLEERRKNRIKELVDGLRVKADVEVDRTHIIRQMRQEPASAVPETQE